MVPVPRMLAVMLVTLKRSVAWVLNIKLFKFNVADTNIPPKPVPILPKSRVLNQLPLVNVGWLEPVVIDRLGALVAEPPAVLPKV